MARYQITCPYCFEDFMDDQVAFRMETVYPSIDEIGFSNPDTGARYFELDDIKADSSLDDAVRAGLIDRFKVFSGLVAGPDQQYDDFWSAFGGGTTEMPDSSKSASDGITEDDVYPWMRPVHVPAEEPDYFLDKGDVTDNGMLYRIMDAGGHETTRRVCPFCHNPLPGLYGQYPVKFIPVIGMTGVGKTVYLSQLVGHLRELFDQCGIMAQPTSPDTDRCRNANPVEMNVPLPYATMPTMLLQPLFVDLAYTDEVGRPHALTVVFYDIAGENFRQFSDDESAIASQAISFVPFLQHADGILYFMNPKQLADSEPADALRDSLTMIRNLIAGDDPVRIPVALCVTKGDTVAQQVFGDNAVPQTEPLMNGGKYRPLFNADNFNAVYGPVSNFVGRSPAFTAEMPVQYPNHDLFIVSALGAAPATVTDDDGHTEPMPSVSPVPQRLIEPVLWMLNRFGFIGASGPIDNPCDWTCPQCGDRLASDQGFCPNCRISRQGDWACSVCGTVNPLGNARCSHTEPGLLFAKQCAGMRPAGLRQMAAALDPAAMPPEAMPETQPTSRPAPMYAPARNAGSSVNPAASVSSFLNGQGSLGQLMNDARRYVHSEEFAAQRDKTIGDLSARFEEGKRRAKAAAKTAAEEARRAAADAKRVAEETGKSAKQTYDGWAASGNASSGNPFAYPPAADFGHSASPVSPVPPSPPLRSRSAQQSVSASDGGSSQGSGLHCSNCGALLDSDELFCTRCGAPTR